MLDSTTTVRIELQEPVERLRETGKIVPRHISLARRLIGEVVLHPRMGHRRLLRRVYRAFEKLKVRQSVTSFDAFLNVGGIEAGSQGLLFVKSARGKT